MALWRAIAWFYILIVVAFLTLSSPFVHSSNFQGGRKLSNIHQGLAFTQGFQNNNQGTTRAVKIGGNVGKAIGESAREVPAGPDPLHHHSISPSGPSLIPTP